MAASDDASDISEADVNKLAHTLGDLDDLDADLFGDALNKKNNAGKPTTPRRNAPASNTKKSPTRVQSPTRSETPTSPPGSARTNLKRKPVKPPSPSTTPSNPLVFSPRSIHPEPKPGTAPGKMTDLSLASERLVPGQKTHQRPETVPKVKKKFDFGDFDPDDPLAGILSGSDDISESDRPKSATQKPAVASKPMTREDVVMPVKKSSPQVLPDSPRKHNLLNRPPTRSGSSLGDTIAATVVNTAPDVDIGSSQTGLKAQAGIFSDSDDLLDGLGLDEKPATPAKQNNAAALKVKPGDSEENRPARSIFDSLLGKGSSTASQLLERKEKKEFVLDKKYSSSHVDGSTGGQDEENGFLFGSYQPSAASGSRPNSRRSVRFQDDDDIFGLESRPSLSAKSPGVRKAPPDMEWLETVAKESAPFAAKTVPAPQQGTTAIKTVPAPQVTSATIQTESAPLVSKSSVTPTSQKALQSPKKTVASVEKDVTGATDSVISNSGSSARAWLGLEDSESDGELFKPKKSPAHSAGLPHSPVVSSANASPRIFPKKPSKKSAAPPSKENLAVSVLQDNDDDDDWLARARSRRQQMLVKEEGKRTENILDKSTTALDNEREAGASASKADYNALSIDPPNFGGSLNSEQATDLFSLPQSHPPRISDWESSKSAFRKDTNLQQLGGQKSAVSNSPLQGPLTDTRLHLSSSVIEQEQLGGRKPLSSQLGVSSTPEELDIQRMQQKQENLYQQQSHPQQQFQQQQQQSHPQQQFQQQQQQQNRLQNSTQHQVYPADHEQLASQLIHQHRQQQQSQSFSVAMPTYSQMSSATKLPDSLPEAQAVIKKLDLEKTYSESVLESTRRRYEEEMLAVESSYKNRLQIIEDSNRKREARLREENEELMQQHLAKSRQLEQEKSDLNTSHYRRLEDLERQRAEDLEKQREQHRLSLATLKREHEEALERLASAKNQEINMVANANDTSKSLTAVVQQIQSNARDLGELQIKIDSWNRQGLDEREISLRSKDEQLRILQERLNRQAEDNDRERSRLEDLIAHMEAQLREQTRSLEEDRWKLKQDQSRAEAQQRSLEEERRQWLEQQARERMNVERARENFLEEQSRSVVQISEERRMLTEQRTTFQVENKSYRDKVHQEAIKRSQAEAEYEALMRTIAEEKVYQNTRRQELQREEERISSDRTKLERERSKLEQDQERLATQARQIREQSEQIDRLTETARRSQQEGEQAMDEASQFRVHIERREAEVQQQLNGFKLLENHIAEEKLRLAKEKKEVENLKNSSLCANCRSPVQGNNVPTQNGIYSPHVSNLGLQPVPAVHKSLSVNQLSNGPLDHIALSIANDRAVRMWKIDAIRDKDFLQEENIYLEGLRHAPYH